MRSGLSPLHHALLGLLARGAASGYDLRAVFQHTPLGAYSDSPGSIYPALGRLQRGRYLSAAVEAGGRRRRTFRLTPRGRDALARWASAPVTAADLVRGTAMVDLRLAFISEIAPARLVPYLREYAAALRQHHAALVSARAAITATLSRSARLALDLGIEVVRARLAWCERQLRSRSR